jgi:hypothetical protein
MLIPREVSITACARVKKALGSTYVRMLAWDLIHHAEELEVWGDGKIFLEEFVVAGEKMNGLVHRDPEGFLSVNIREGPIPAEARELLSPA